MTAPTPETQPGTATPAPEAPAAPPAEPNQDDLPQWARDAITKANREAASYRTQVAELKPRADQFRQLEEASKSEAQRQQEALEAANRTAETARADAIRYKTAATYGIGADHFDLLGSGTEQEITDRAAKIAALVTAQSASTTTPVTPPATRPVEQLRPGATPSTAQSEDDAIYAALFGPPK